MNNKQELVRLSRGKGLLECIVGARPSKLRGRSR